MMGSENLAKDLAGAEAELRRAARRLADEEAKAAVAVADGGRLRDLSRYEHAVQKAKSNARTLRQALDLAKRREQRQQEAAKRVEQEQARQHFREQAHALAAELDDVLEAGRELRIASAAAARCKAVPLGAGGASPEAEHAITAWRDRLRAVKRVGSSASRPPR